MISLEQVPPNHTYQPNNVCPGCLDIFLEKVGADVLCHKGLKDAKVMQCFIDKNCAETWARIRIESVGLNLDGSLDCYNCRTALDPTSILNQEEVDRLIEGDEEIEIVLPQPPRAVPRSMNLSDRLALGMGVGALLISSIYAGSVLGESLLTNVAFAVGALVAQGLPAYGAFLVSEVEDEPLGSIVILFAGTIFFGVGLAAAADLQLPIGAICVAGGITVAAAAGGLGAAIGDAIGVASRCFNYLRGNAA